MRRNNCGFLLRLFLCWCCLAVSFGGLAAPPKIICWFVDASTGKHIIPADNSTLWPQLFSFNQSQYQFIFPIMDLDDSIVTAEMIQNRFLQPIRQQSTRYDADYLLLGQLFFVNQRWEMNWSLASQNAQNQPLIQGHASGMQQEIPMHVLSAIDEYMQKSSIVLTENEVIEPPLGIIVSSDFENQHSADTGVPLY